VTAADDDDALQQYLSLELHTIEDISAEVFVWRNNTRVEKYYIYTIVIAACNESNEKSRRCNFA
jgi:hypothetical protein